MGLFDVFRRPPATDELMRDALVKLVMTRLRNMRGIRAEDAVCGMATITGERCIDVAGEFPLRDHTFPPGQRVFSTRINEILCGDNSDFGPDTYPLESVYGQLRAKLSRVQFKAEHYPSLKTVFESFAAGVGKPELWGRVPVTVPPENTPSIIPLQFGYETRGKVDAILEQASTDKARCLRIATWALADLMNTIGPVLAPATGLAIALETINGMAKTAPMTDAGMKQAKQQLKQRPPETR